MLWPWLGLFSWRRILRYSVSETLSALFLHEWITAPVLDRSHPAFERNGHASSGPYCRETCCFVLVSFTRSLWDLSCMFGFRLALALGNEHGIGSHVQNHKTMIKQNLNTTLILSYRRVKEMAETCPGTAKLFWEPSRVILCWGEAAQRLLLRLNPRPIAEFNMTNITFFRIFTSRTFVFRQVNQFCFFFTCHAQWAADFPFCNHLS